MNYPSRASKSAAISNIFADIEDDFDDSLEQNFVDENIIDGCGDSNEEISPEILEVIDEDDGGVLPLEMLDKVDTLNDNLSDEEEILPLRKRIGAPSDHQELSSDWKWIDPKSCAAKVPAKNICRFKSGPKLGIHPITEMESLMLFLDNIIPILQQYTNLAGRRMVQLYKNSHVSRNVSWKAITTNELKAFLGLHIIGGAYGSQYRQAKELWSDMHGQPIFRATMSEQRFRAIKRCFRMDDPLRRDKSDKLSPVRHVWEIFQKKLTEYYIPGPYLTIDEQLVEYHGRVAFKQYIKSKPGKFGLKIFWVNDATSSFALKGIVYIGEQTLSDKTRPFSEVISLELAMPFLKESRNITCDNCMVHLNRSCRKTTE